MLRLLLLLLTTALAATGQPLAPRQLEPVFAATSFEKPVFLTHAGDGSGRVFIVEQAGVIRVLDPVTGSVATFFDHRRQVNSGPNEAGLLGLAFHPQYASNGRLFVSYTGGNLESRIAEIRISDDPDSLDGASERVLLRIDQPAGNHNGGMLAFGADGMLYAGFGDGGGSNDGFRNGQDPTTLLGTILRLDVDHAAAGQAYGIPADNPFVGNTDGWREEIWAWGLRNPWRFSFDRIAGGLWVGDVGQNRQEEIDLVRRGGNYGWNVQEGFECFRAQTCDASTLLPPVLQYGRGDGVSVTGGYVYRGRQLGELYGAYVYGDFGSRKVWAIRHDGTAITDSALVLTAPVNITSFGEDEAGELYVLGYDGRIFRFLPLAGESPVITAVGEIADTSPRSFELWQNYPNPFNATTTISYRLHEAALVQLTIFDILGQHVRTLVSSWQQPGTLQTKWTGDDASGLAAAPGVYFYRLSVGNDAVQTRRMLLLK
jgi:glucose/arabinose dehydrogenase